jgi:ADP-L-glycero-D-manno-heptose 6-epimerase
MPSFGHDDRVRKGGGMKRVIVTGGAGFIGSVLVEKFNREGVDDIVIVDHLGKGDKWRNLTGLRFSDYLAKDDFLERIGGGTWTDVPDAIVHLGACTDTTETDVDYLMANNYEYSRVLAQWAAAREVRFLYASSAATYGDGVCGFDDAVDLDRLRPLNPYGFSKHLFDLWARRSGFLDRAAGLKFFNVYGPNEGHKGEMASFVFKAVCQIRSTGRVRLFKSRHPDWDDGEQRRDFVYVKDCVDVLWWLLEHDRINGLFNLGGGRARSWNDLARAVFAALGLPPAIDYVEMPDALRGRYQYFTEARMDGLSATGCPLSFRCLEEGVEDYVRNHPEAWADDRPDQG